MRIAMILWGFPLLLLPASAQDKKRPEVLSLSKTAVWSLTFSPDGKTLASASVGRPPHNDLKVWEVATGELQASLSGHSEHIFCVAFSPDGKALATTSQDKTVRLWDLAAKKEKAVLLRGLTPFKTVRFSADGKTLGASGNKWIRLVDVSNGKEKTAFEIHPTGGGYCFHPTLELMAYAPDAWYIHLVDTSTSKTRTLLTGLKGNAQSMTFSDDGKWLASYSFDNSLRIWDVTAGKQKAIFNIAQGRSIALNKDGSMVALGFNDGTVRRWDLTTSKELPALRDARVGHVYSIAFSPDSTTLAAGGMGVIRLWSLP